MVDEGMPIKVFLDKTCDHGVPDKVSYENYMYYRKRIMGMDS